MKVETCKLHLFLNDSFKMTVIYMDSMRSCFHVTFAHVSFFIDVGRKLLKGPMVFIFLKRFPFWLLALRFLSQL